MEKEKNIWIFIDRKWFEDEPNHNGVYYPECDEIYLKEMDGYVLLHELIHAIENDSRTKKVVTKLFDLEGFKKRIDWEEYCEDCLSNYPEEEYESETYAYQIELDLEYRFNDSKMAIGYFLGYIESITGVRVKLIFQTVDINQLNFKNN